MDLLVVLKRSLKASVLWGLKTAYVPVVRPSEVIVLNYHSLPTRERFAAQMEVLAECRYPVLSVPEFQGWLAGLKPLRTPAVLLTFDDCYLNQFENAVPVLQSFGLPAVFFPVLGCLGRQSGLAHEFAHTPDLPLMDREQVFEIAKAGYTIGCHTHTHPHLTKVLPEQVEQEVTNAKQALEDLLGQSVNLFCYPYGDYNAAVIGTVRRAGFDAAFTVDRGVVLSGDDPYRLKRLPVLGEPSRLEFQAYLSGTILLYWRLRRYLRF